MLACPRCRVERALLLAESGLARNRAGPWSAWPVRGACLTGHVRGILAGVPCCCTLLMYCIKRAPNNGRNFESPAKACCAPGTRFGIEHLPSREPSTLETRPATAMLNPAISATVSSGADWPSGLPVTKQLACAWTVEAAASQSTHLPRRCQCERLRDGIRVMQADHLNHVVGATTDAHREKARVVTCCLAQGRVLPGPDWRWAGEPSELSDPATQGHEVV